MNPFLRDARAPILEYLGLDEIETVSTRIYCDTPDLPEVVGWMRPRVNGRYGRSQLYNAPKHQKAMREVADKYRAARGTIRGEFAGPVLFAVVSHRKVPKSWPKRRIGEQDTTKPDSSNILKLVEDALNGIAYKDDCQIVGELPLKAPRLGDRDWLEIEVTYCEPKG